MFQNSKCDYTLRCLLQVARGYEKKLVTIQQVAKLEKLSEANVAKFLRQLRLAGFIRSVRGAGGGYEMARPPSAISVYEVLTALTPATPQKNVCEGKSGGKQPCPHSTACNLQTLWQMPEILLKSFFDAISLQELLASQSALQERVQRQVGISLEVTRSAIRKH